MLTVKEAKQLCDEILDMIENEVSEKAKDTAQDFFESVEEKVKNMQEWIEKNNHVTPKMVDSLKGMRSGVQKWIR